MPEYLAPGVYVEEVSFRGKSIEGVSTSVTGFVGPTRYGPVGGVPEILTSFGDYERTYGGVDSLQFGADDAAETACDMAHGVRAFFDNGGSKLYVTRIFQERAVGNTGVATLTHGAVTLAARFPGRAGNAHVSFNYSAGGNLRAADGSIAGVSAGDVVFVKTAGTLDPANMPAGDQFAVVAVAGDGTVTLDDTGGTEIDISAGTERIHRILLNVSVRVHGAFAVAETEEGFSARTDIEDQHSIFGAFRAEPTSRMRALTQAIAITTASTSPAAVMRDLARADVGAVGAVENALSRALALDDELPEALSRPGLDELTSTLTLTGGNDGALPAHTAYRGRETGSVKTGLETLADVEEISIIAAPGYSRGGNADAARYQSITGHLITHCDRMRYRVAVIDAPNGQAISEARASRASIDSVRAAFYYPWVTVLDPLDATGKREIQLPPSGYVSGIYARNDNERGVFKAPANEVVRGAINFEVTLNKAQQDVLNPDGVNCFRSFEGRGLRLWGARTATSDPEWKYISVRRYFCYLERSIEKGTQWAVFEPNGPRLWSNIRQTITDFLINEWKSGALLGKSPEEAFFVTCDRSTMTQYNLDNGQLVCLIGVAVVKPAEFVIFRIGQKTADAQ